jgi:hypothetical protein
MRTLIKDLVDIHPGTLAEVLRYSAETHDASTIALFAVTCHVNLSDVTPSLQQLYNCRYVPLLSEKIAYEYPPTSLTSYWRSYRRTRRRNTALSFATVT